MGSRKKIVDFALERMSGFTLEGSSEGDNRSIFGLIKTLVLSGPGDTLADCRKPLAAVLNMEAFDQRLRFQGCKVTFLQHTISTIFGGSGHLLAEKEFAWCDGRDKLLEYLEICRRIFVSKYAPSIPDSAGKKDETIGALREQKPETALERAFRLAREKIG